MNRLAAALATIVRSRLDQAMTDEGAEVRLIFHGPPLEILRDVFDMLVDGSGRDGPPVPILLQVPSLATGQVNPAVGASGHCDETHLLVLRNSPARPTYVALVPPGQHSNKSVSTTTDEFGMLSANNAGNVPFEDWWADDFLQEVVGIGIAQAGVPEESREGARALVEHAANACDEVDRERIQRASAWRVVSRVFSAYPVGDDLSPASRLSLACGLPPMQSGGLSPREQVSTLEKVADALADGFNAGVARAQESATDEDLATLGDFLAHLRVACDRPTAFERAAAAYYAPASGLVVVPAPAWWTSLTVEKWSELLAEEASATGDIIMVCSNGIVPLGKGMPVLVEEEVELQFETVGLDASNAVVTIERTPGGPAGKEVGQVRADSGRTFQDARPPVHRTPMRYVASAEHFKPGAIKVVSLATWAPGIFVACRLARKLTPPKRRKGKGSPEYEASLLLPGAGRYELLVFCSPGISLDETAAGNPDDAAERGDAAATLAVRTIRPRQYQVEVELDGNYQLDIGFGREAPDGTISHEACRAFLSIEEVQQQGCRSEFERLIRANRRVLQPAEARAIVQLNRNARSSSLQDWMLSADLAARSYMPVIIAEDYVGSWVQPSWSEASGPVFSSGRFLKDPRPAPSEFLPPAGFVEARVALAERIRGGGDETGLVESAQLGKWLSTDEAFRGLIEQYLSSYQAWLAAEPDVACWVDVIAVTSLQQDGRTLSRVPDAVMLSPLHPVRLAWQAMAQMVLLEADEADKPCPAASVLDPDCIPDILSMALRSPAGIDHVDFVAVENGTDYWSVLWNGRQLTGLPARSQMAPFGDGFGISVGGISVGFSAAQVGRALDDVSDLLAAKPVVGIAVTSAGGTTDACNEGLIGWCASRYQEDEGRPVRQSVGHRHVNIFDDRDSASRPDDARIANLSEDTGNKVRWFDGQPAGVVPDLGIIAQLDMSEPGASRVENRTPLGHAGLIRHRIRRQLSASMDYEDYLAEITLQRYLDPAWLVGSPGAPDESFDFGQAQWIAAESEETSLLFYPASPNGALANERPWLRVRKQGESIEVLVAKPALDPTFQPELPVAEVPDEENSVAWLRVAAVSRNEGSARLDFLHSPLDAGRAVLSIFLRRKGQAPLLLRSIPYVVPENFDARRVKLAGHRAMPTKASDQTPPQWSRVSRNFDAIHGAKPGSPEVTEAVSVSMLEARMSSGDKGISLYQPTRIGPDKEFWPRGKREKPDSPSHYQSHVAMLVSENVETLGAEIEHPHFAHLVCGNGILAEGKLDPSRANYVRLMEFEVVAVIKGHVAGVPADVLPDIYQRPRFDLTAIGFDRARQVTTVLSLCIRITADRAARLALKGLSLDLAPDFEPLEVARVEPLAGEFKVDLGWTRNPDYPIAEILMDLHVMVDGTVRGGPARCIFDNGSTTDANSTSTPERLFPRFDAPKDDRSQGLAVTEAQPKFEHGDHTIWLEIGLLGSGAGQGFQGSVDFDWFFGAGEAHANEAVELEGLRAMLEAQAQLTRFTAPIPVLSNG